MLCKICSIILVKLAPYTWHPSPYTCFKCWRFSVDSCWSLCLLYVVTGGQVFSGGDPGECGTVAGVSAAATQLETCVQLYETRRHSAADGACVHGCWLDIVHWQVSTGTVLLLLSHIVLRHVLSSCQLQEYCPVAYYTVHIKCWNRWEWWEECYTRVYSVCQLNEVILKFIFCNIHWLIS